MTDCKQEPPFKALCPNCEVCLTLSEMVKHLGEYCEAANK